MEIGSYSSYVEYFGSDSKYMSLVSFIEQIGIDANRKVGTF